MQWNEVLTLNPIYLNLGGGRNRHPRPGYEHYVSVDIQPRGPDWSVQQDLTCPVPLPDESVTRILSEDFFEHLEINEISGLLKECYRILKPGGLMRIAVPDYQNPKDAACLALGCDPRYPEHKTLTTYTLVRPLVEQSPFRRWQFLHYWENGKFIQQPIDYSLGYIQRTPEHFYLDKRLILHFRIFLGISAVKRFLTRAKEPLSPYRGEIRFGHPLYATELVVDLYKD